jgi:hypothetical protein
MSTGAIMLIVISAVAVGDLLIALYFRSLADRVETGENVSNNIEPASARRIATMLLIGAPVMWFVVFLISFGLIPTGIDPIKL